MLAGCTTCNGWMWRDATVLREATKTKMTGHERSTSRTKNTALTPSGRSLAVAPWRALPCPALLDPFLRIHVHMHRKGKARPPATTSRRLHARRGGGGPYAWRVAMGHATQYQTHASSANQGSREGSPASPPPVNPFPQHMFLHTTQHTPTPPAHTHTQSIRADAGL